MTKARPTSSGQLYRELQLAADEFNRLTELAHALGLEVVAELLPVRGDHGGALRPVLVAKLCAGQEDRPMR